MHTQILKPFHYTLLAFLLLQVFSDLQDSLVELEAALDACEALHRLAPPGSQGGSQGGSQDGVQGGSSGAMALRKPMGFFRRKKAGGEGGKKTGTTGTTGTTGKTGVFGMTG